MYLRIWSYQDQLEEFILPYEKLSCHVNVIIEVFKLPEACKT